MAKPRKQTDVPFGAVRLSETIQGAGQTPVYMPKVPQDNSMLQLSRGLSQFSNLLGQYSNIQLKRGQDTAAVMSTDDVIAAIEKQQEQDKIPLTERIGFQKGYSQQLYSRYLETKVIPMFNDLSNELANINADEFEAKGVDDFDDFIAAKVKDIEDKALGYIGDNPFQMQVHNAAFEPVKTKFSVQERDKYIKKQSAWANTREIEILSNDMYNALNATQAGDEPLTEGLEGSDEPTNFGAFFEDRIDSVINNFEARAGALNMSPAAKTKAIQDSIVGAVAPFVNLPDSDMPERFDKAKLFLDEARKKLRFKSQAGQAALAAGYKTVDAAEAKFERDNENLPADIVKDLMLKDGIRRNLEILANNPGEIVEFNGQTFDSLNSFTQELTKVHNLTEKGRPYGGTSETQIAFRDGVEDFVSEYETKVSDKVQTFSREADAANFIKREFDITAILSQLYPKEVHLNDPSIYEAEEITKFDQVRGFTKEIQIATQNALIPIQEEITNELYGDVDDYVRTTPAPSRKERNKFIQSTATELAKAKLPAALEFLKEEFDLNQINQSSNRSLNSGFKSSRKQIEEAYKSQKDQLKGMTDQEIKTEVLKETAKATPNTFGVDKDGNLIITKDDSIFDFDRGKLFGFIEVNANYEIEDIQQLKTKYLNSRDAGLFEGKEEDVDTVFGFLKEMVKESDEIESILDALHPSFFDPYHPGGPKHVFPKVTGGQRLKLNRRMRDLLRYSGVLEDDAAQGYIKIGGKDFDLENALRSQDVAREDGEVGFGWQVMPILTYDSVKNKNINRVIQKVQTIIDMNNLVNANGAKLTAKEFIDAQDLIFKQGTIARPRQQQQNNNN